MNSHEIDYKIIGEDIQIVEIELDPTKLSLWKQVLCYSMKRAFSLKPKWAMAEKNQSIMGKIFSGRYVALTGESLFMTHFTNRGQVQTKSSLCSILILVR
jgi:uncharacterized protein (AIM24 family)